MRPLLLLVFCVSLSYANETTLPPAPTPEKLRKMFHHSTVYLKHDDAFVNKEAKKIILGRALFYDKRLSKDKTISCNDCHDLTKYGTNGDYYQKEKEAKRFYRDVPSVYNKAKLTLFNWAGSHKTLSAKLEEAILSKHEMGMENKTSALDRILAIKGYKTLFNDAYPGKSINFELIIDALNMFHQGLITPAPIDRFMNGDDKALTENQLRGGALFDERSCSACHTGANFGGQMLQKLGTVEEWPNQNDLGVYEYSKSPKYKMVFRVSPLRNVSQTAPYFHDASSRRPWDAIRKMSWYELGHQISVQDTLLIQDFMKSFTGEIPMNYIKKPELPQ